ncbi:MAG: GYD domain-containing protein [Chloroflexota bacterium]|nr:GYD domain-containing protein [Chloroflexota bacterium]
MPRYLLQVSYTSDGWGTLVKNPQDRIKAITPVVEGHRGKVIDGYLCFGEYDLIAIIEMPNNVSAAAFAIAAAAGGAVKEIKTTPLMTTSEGIEAMRQAASSKYRPASSSKTAARKK